MTNKPPRICVVGSINMDLTIESLSMPKQGETLLGRSFETYPGGKGANQAVAASRIGADVTMIGAVGTDPFGQTLIQHLERERIHTDGIAEISDEATGIANIIITEQDNRIIVIPGANNHVTPEVIDHHKEILLNSDIVLLQFEIPMTTVEYTVKLAHDNNIPVIVNPAPFQNLSNDLLEKATYITPNEIEAAALEESHVDQLPYEKFIITMGADGVKYHQADLNPVHVRAFDVHPTDTTGAGDTFNGVLAVALSEGRSIEEAITFASKASALSITAIGAQNGMPTREAVEASRLSLK